MEVLKSPDYLPRKVAEKLNAELEDRVKQRTEELETSTRQLLQTERLQSLALAAGKMGTWSYDTVNGQCSWDEGQCHIFGLQSHNCAAPVENLRSLIHPDDWQRLRETRAQSRPRKNGPKAALVTKFFQIGATRR